MQYHPDPFDEKIMGTRSHRDVRKRLKLIRSLLDFSGKSLIDLGCNAGFFSFNLSRECSRVCGIDSDNLLITRNSEIAKKQSITNINFINGNISPDFIKGLESADIILFLSVLHHIIADSGVYHTADTSSSGTEYAVEILKAICMKCEYLLFEMGQSNENYDWAERLPDMGKHPDRWIENNLIIPSGFSVVTVIDPLKRSCIKKRLMFSQFNKRIYDGDIFARLFRRLFKYDDRDSRYLFLVKRKTAE